MSEVRWLKASFSEEGGNNCVEIATVPEGIAMRESDEPYRVVIADPKALRALIAAVKSGRFAAPDSV